MSESECGSECESERRSESNSLRVCVCVIVQIISTGQNKIGSHSLISWRSHATVFV